MAGFAEKYGNLIGGGAGRVGFAEKYGHLVVPRPQHKDASTLMHELAPKPQPRHDAPAEAPKPDDAWSHGTFLPHAFTEEYPEGWQDPRIPLDQAMVGSGIEHLAEAAKSLVTGPFELADRFRQSHSAGDVGQAVGDAALGLAPGVEHAARIAAASPGDRAQELEHSLRGGLLFDAPASVMGLASIPHLAHSVSSSLLPKPPAPPALQIPGGGLPSEPMRPPAPQLLTEAPPAPPPPQGQLPPGAPPPPQLTGAWTNDPSRMLPPGVDTAPMPQPGAPTVDPRTGEVLQNGQPAAQGQAIRVPPGGFEEPRINLPMAPQQLPIAPPAPPPVVRRTSAVMPDQVSIAPPPPHPGMPTVEAGTLRQPVLMPHPAPVFGDPINDININNLSFEPGPEHTVPPPPPVPPVIDGEFERVPPDTQDAEFTHEPDLVRKAREASTPPVQAQPVPPPVQGPAEATAGNAPRQRARVMRYDEDPAAYEAALHQLNRDNLPPPGPPPVPPGIAPKRDDQTAGGAIWPNLPPADTTGRDLATPGRHANARDAAMTRATAVGSFLGPTEDRMAQAGAPIAEGTGGTGIADLASEAKARSEQRASGFTDNVLQGIDKKFPEGSEGDLAAARWVEGKATPEDVELLRQNPELQAAAERWKRGAKEAADNPAFEIKGHLDNYLTHARARNQNPTVMGFLQELERGSANPELRDSYLTQYMQRSRGGEPSAPPSLVRAARAYGRAGAFQMDIKPVLEQVKTFTDSKLPDGSPAFDAADKELIQNYMSDSIIGREQFADALVRRTPGVSHATALVNKGLASIGLPTIDNPLKSAINAGKKLAEITQVRPAAAALSHFIGDAWPKIAEKGTAGVAEYAEGARKMMAGIPKDEWDRLQRLGVASPLPTSEASNPVFRGLSNAATATMKLVQTIDTTSKLGTFYTEEARLIKAGKTQAQAESMAATITRARNYYPNAAMSIPLAAQRTASPFYQFAKPTANAIDNMRNWFAQGNGAAFARTGLGITGLALLGQLTGTNLLQRAHVVPHGLQAPMLSPGSSLGILKDDPLGVATQEDRKANARAGYRAYLNRKRRKTTGGE